MNATIIVASIMVARAVSMIALCGLFGWSIYLLNRVDGWICLVVLIGTFIVWYGGFSINEEKKTKQKE